jgi:peptidoglycan/xylan/chitin deacetylase (PgdA/CDA1 family)
MRMMSQLGFKGLSIKDLRPYLKGEKTGKVFGITFDDGYVDNFLYALPVLKSLKFTATCYIVSSHIGGQNDWTRDQNVQECSLMDREQIQAWIREGMSIGSHSHTHAHLCKLSPEDLEKELLLSKKTLENLFHITIEDFCFPYGEFNTTIIEDLKKYGYQSATTTQRGRFSPTHSLYALPRVHMTKRTVLLLMLLKMMTSYEDRRYREHKKC